MVWPELRVVASDNKRKVFVYISTGSGASCHVLLLVKVTLTNTLFLLFLLILIAMATNHNTISDLQPTTIFGHFIWPIFSFWVLMLVLWYTFKFNGGWIYIYPYEPFRASIITCFFTCNYCFSIGGFCLFSCNCWMPREYCL